MISTFPPWNFLPLILSPFYFILTDTVAFNEVVCHICYVPVMVFVTIVFIVCNILIIPLAYFKGIFTKIQFLFNSKIEKSVGKRILTFFAFILFGLFILMINLVVDIGVFFKHLYQAKINYRKEKSRIKYISSKTYNQLQLKFDQDCKNGVEALPFEETAEYCRSLMGILDLLRDIIFAKNTVDIPFERQLFKLQEYGKVKNVLDSGSIQYGSQKFIFSIIWKNVMKELKVNSRIRKILKQVKVSLNSKVSVQDLQHDFQKDSKDYLAQFLQISFADVHNAITATEDKELTIEAIKETIESVLFEQTKEGQKVAQKMNKKSPFRKQTTMMNRTESNW
jgi:hypothetical protein